MMNDLHVFREPLVHGLAHRSGAGVGGGDQPNCRLGRNSANDKAQRWAFTDVGVFGFIDDHARIACVFRRLLDVKRHSHGNRCADERWNPKQPSPMHRREMNYSENGYTSKQGGAKPGNAKAPEIDHESENASETTALE